jgi:hypothetical protein
MEPPSATHAIALIVHLLLFVYWLGGDVGVFYSSRFVVDSGRSREARLTAAKIMLDLDLIPRICMSLMLTVGAILNEFHGIAHPAWQMAALLALGPFWLAMVLYLHFRAGTVVALRVQRFDFWFRWFMIAAILASAANSLATGRLAGDPWITAKLLIFAFLIFCGLMIRIRMPPFIEGFRALAADRTTADGDARMRASLARMRPWVLAIWVGVFASAVLGVLQPGGSG